MAKRLTHKALSGLNRQDIEELDFVPVINDGEIRATVGFKIRGLGWFYCYDYKFSLSQFETYEASPQPEPRCWSSKRDKWI